MKHQKILILDFGSQVTQLIARRVREAGVFAEIHPCTVSDDFVRAFGAEGVILSGGPASVHENLDLRAPQSVFDLGVPVLGICYGQQTMCDQLGGTVEPSNQREFGRADIDIIANCPLVSSFWPQNSRHAVWMSHGDKVTKIPDGFEVIAKTAHTPFAMIADEKRRFYGVQFHPEVTHTPQGEKLIRAFVRDICGCVGDWSMANFRKESREKIRAQIGNGRVVCGLSGGVDSSVTAILLHEAIGEQLTCIFVDTGFMRKGEPEQVESLFRNHYNIPLIHVRAENRFMTALSGVDDPEQKRKIIGKLFIDIFEEESNKIGQVDFLAQGTLYPDVVESLSSFGGPSHTIKSHHNVGGLPERMKLKLVEPLRELFKDEVRALGREMGMKEDFIDRHPFPGPGLAIRIPGAVSLEKAALLREADAIFIEELRKNDLYHKVWQAFVVLLPVRSVGVMGDGRTYDYVCALRAVTSTDGMTADYVPFDHDFLGHVSRRIVNEVRGINRVVYDITSKPPGTIEWE